MDIKLTLTFSEYKLLRNLASNILGIELKPKIKTLLKKSEEELEKLLFEAIDNGKIEKGLYYKGDVLLLIMGFTSYDINHSLRMTLGKVLRKYGIYKNSKKNQWKLK